MVINANIFLATESARVDNALLNSLMCIFITFLLLVFISFVISLIKFVNKFNGKNDTGKSTDKAATVKTTGKTAVDEAASTVEVDETDVEEVELVAVVTAAIHAYEESVGVAIPADGLVVRSIRNVGRRWQEA